MTTPEYARMWEVVAGATDRRRFGPCLSGRQWRTVRDDCSPDATAWMTLDPLNLLRISLKLALHRPVYEDIATKSLQHFLEITDAMRNAGGHAIELWN